MAGRRHGGPLRTGTRLLCDSYSPRIRSTLTRRTMMTGRCYRGPLRSWARGYRTAGTPLQARLTALTRKDKDGRTALWWASRYGYEAIVEVLLATGEAEVNLQSRYGWTPLSQAAERGHEAVVRLLLATNEVDVDSKSNSLRTPLSCAAEGRHETVVKLLLENSLALKSVISIRRSAPPRIIVESILPSK